MSEDIDWKKGDILETPDGRQFMFGHYEGLGFWVHRITKDGRMDQSSLGKWLQRKGVKRADFDPAKRGGWLAHTARPVARKPAKKRKPPRPHRWSGAGYVCADCGAIKDTFMEKGDCPGGDKTGFDLWLYHAGAGWWLDEEGLPTAARASAILARKVGTGNTVAGAVLPAGQPLGLFTRSKLT